MIKIPEVIININDEIEISGGKLFIVGGYVRDYLLNISSKDVDMEVFNLSIDKLYDILYKYGHLRFYEKFGVFVLTINEEVYEFAIPREERKVGNLYTDFDIEINQNLTIHQAARRRDFTINAIYYDISNREVIDPYNGTKDIEAKLLRYVSDQFIEDPLRVFRALRFSSELDFKLEEQTFNKCMDMVELLKYVNTERVNYEFKRMITGKYFNKNLDDIIEILFSYFTLIMDNGYNLCELNDYEQCNKYHPEGNVLRHIKQTIYIIDYLNIEDEKTIYIIKTALLLHDIGKIKDTYFVNGVIKNTNHEETSYIFSQDIIDKLLINKKDKKLILRLIRDHMIPYRLDEMNEYEVFDLFNCYKDNIYLLLYVSLADKSGRLKEFNDINAINFIEVNKNKMYNIWDELYNEYIKLMQVYNGEYYINRGIYGSKIKEEQRNDVSKQLCNIYKDKNI